MQNQEIKNKYNQNEMILKLESLETKIQSNI
jgi:hypothetical protein